jgi:glyoxylase-like metal-dependent hydrolase (beta-lactamase superfamily II)
MQLADWQWFAVDTGRFRLDGGAMFGNVPKVLWEKQLPADENNRIEMALRSLLLKKDDKLILVDTGMGHKWSEKQMDMYQLDYSKYNLKDSLDVLGFSTEDITDVILTHLHFDHTGGSTEWVDEELKPTFPGARHYVQRANLETAQQPNIRERASYLGENFEVLLERELLEILDGEMELFEGLTLKISNGHTVGMQTISLVSGDQGLYYCADLIPTAAHVSPAWTMGYDIHPVMVIEEKQVFLDDVEKHNGILFYEHDPYVCATTLGKDKRGRHAAGDVVLKPR